MSGLPLQPPSTLKPVSHYLKVAVEHDSRDKVIAYWARFAAVQKALSIDKSSPEAKVFVITLLDWLEKQKKELAGNEAITIEAAGEAHIENYALKLFSWADQSDKKGEFNKNVVKAFYTSGILFDILESLRPPLSDDFQKARKYSKWKAAYIHNCLKNGETPISGTGAMDDEEDEVGAGGGGTSYGFINPKPTEPSENAWGSQDTNSDNQFDSQPQVPYGGGLGAYGVPPSSFGGVPPSSFGGQQPAPYVPPPQAIVPAPDMTAGTVPSNLSIDKIAKAQKYCKWAGSALNFDDVASAIENLEKALHLLKTGQEL